MNKKEWIEIVANKTGQSKEIVTEVLESGLEENPDFIESLSPISHHHAEAVLAAAVRSPLMRVGNFEYFFAAEGHGAENQHNKQTRQ